MTKAPTMRYVAIMCQVRLTENLPWYTEEMQSKLAALRQCEAPEERAKLYRHINLLRKYPHVQLEKTIWELQNEYQKRELLEGSIDGGGERNSDRLHVQAACGSWLGARCAGWLGDMLKYINAKLGGELSHQGNGSAGAIGVQEKETCAAY